MLTTDQEYRDIIKFPGRYNLKDTHKLREKAAYFEKYGYYCPFVENTHDYIKFWDDEKYKILNGTWIDGFYIPGFYYFYLNYLQIYLKQENKHGFPHIYDMDYHTFLCLEHAIFRGEHFSVVKKRQSGFTLKLCTPLIVELWFSFGSPNYIATYEEAQLKKTWSDVLEVYKAHLNEHTGWYREFIPDKTFDWRVAKDITTESGRKVIKGRKNTLKGLVLSKSPSKGVGGGARYIFADESGVNPVLMKFIGFIEPMITYGTKRTGTIIVSGAVGELQHSHDLKEISFNPKAYGFYEVDNVWDENLKDTKCGFFVPASWALYGEDDDGVPFIDEYGNSDVERAEKYIRNKREVLKKQNVEKYLFAISQDPLTLEECFQFRSEAVFPLDLINQQNNILELKSHDGIFVDLYRDQVGKVKHKLLMNGRYVKEFPVNPKGDKIGDIQIFEFPIDNPDYGLYWAGVDIVKESESVNSTSLNTIYIYKASHNIKSEPTSSKIVACYTSRPKDKMDWFEKALMLLEWYNAEALVENNIYWFIEEMIKRKKQQYIAKTPGWVKDINPTSKVIKAYGVNMTEKLMDELVGKIVTYVTEPIYTEFNDDTGEPTVHFGIERIPDRMLLNEMANYRPKSMDKKGNYDRIIGFGLALLHASYNEARGIIVEEYEDIPKINQKRIKLLLRNNFIKRNYNANTLY